eukprot:349939-Pelagomonas_calceolata.AAC.3
MSFPLTQCAANEDPRHSYLALAALGVPPVLLLHVAGAAHQVLLHHIVLDAVQALGADVNLLTARSHGLHHLLSAGPVGVGMCEGTATRA